MHAASAALMLAIVGCAGMKTSPPDDDDAEPAAQANADVNWLPSVYGPGGTVKWQCHTFPGKKSTAYQAMQQDGRQAVRGEALSAASMLRQHVRIDAEQLGRLRFSWKVPQLIAGADMRLRETDDSPVRVILAFDGDRSKFSAKNAMLSELALTLTGEPLPYATLMYVWGNHSEPGSVIINPRTDRIRKMVLESGTEKLNHWQDYERDIVADYVKAFGEAPGALVGIGIMTDTDNTRQKAVAWYGPITLVNRPVAMVGPQDVLASSLVK